MNRVCSIFLKVLKFVPSLEFEAAVCQHRTGRHVRGVAGHAGSNAVRRRTRSLFAVGLGKIGDVDGVPAQFAGLRVLLDCGGADFSPLRLGLELGPA